MTMSVFSWYCSVLVLSDWWMVRHESILVSMFCLALSCRTLLHRPPAYL